MCNTSRTRNIPLVIAAVVPALAFAVVELHIKDFVEEEVVSV